MKLQPASRGDCLLLSSTLRECDRKEIALGRGLSPFQTIHEAWASSDFCESIVTPGDELAGMWGVVPIPTLPGSGSIWMLASDEIESIPTSFLRACQPSIDKAHERYPTLLCAPWRENHLHLRWLRWLGFALEDVGHPHFLKASRHV